MKILSQEKEEEKTIHKLLVRTMKHSFEGLVYMPSYLEDYLA
jgi:hypothetical protein